MTANEMLLEKKKKNKKACNITAAVCGLPIFNVPIYDNVNNLDAWLSTVLHLMSESDMPTCKRLPN